ncbi:hypothetical protein PSPO01_04749 [Paraphaeosphaeria sporulosa]
MARLVGQLTSFHLYLASPGLTGLPRCRACRACLSSLHLHRGNQPVGQRPHNHNIPPPPASSSLQRQSACYCVRAGDTSTLIVGSRARAFAASTATTAPAAAPSRRRLRQRNGAAPEQVSIMHVVMCGSARCLVLSVAFLSLEDWEGIVKIRLDMGETLGRAGPGPGPGLYRRNDKRRREEESAPAMQALHGCARAGTETYAWTKDLPLWKREGQGVASFHWTVAKLFNTQEEFHLQKPIRECRKRITPAGRGLQFPVVRPALQDTALCAFPQHWGDEERWRSLGEYISFHIVWGLNTD